MGAELKIARLAPPPSQAYEEYDDSERISGEYPLGTSDQFIMDGGRNLFFEEPLPNHMVNRFFVTEASDALTPEFVAGSHYTDYQSFIGAWRQSNHMDDLMDAIRSVMSAADAAGAIRVTGNNSGVLTGALIESRVSLYERCMELCGEAIAQIYASPVADNGLEAEVTGADRHSEIQISNLRDLLRSGNGGSNGNVAPGGALPPAAMNDGGIAALPAYHGEEMTESASLACGVETQSAALTALTLSATTAVIG